MDGRNDTEVELDSRIVKSRANEDPRTSRWSRSHVGYSAIWRMVIAGDRSNVRKENKDHSTWWKMIQGIA
jgi:hypothetical protein